MKKIIAIILWSVFSLTIATADEIEGKQSYTNIKYTLDEAFTASETSILEDAIELLAKRLTSKRVEDCYVSANEAANRKLGKFNSTILMKANYSPLVVGDYALTPNRFPDPSLQLFYLKLYLNNTLPHLHINRFRKIGSVRGYALGDDHVHVPYGSSSADDLSGEFKIWLNGYQIGRQDDEGISEAAVWAGVIWHEMMHNLGHLHPKDVYKPQFQIVLYQRCVAHNGSFEIDGENGEPDDGMVCGAHHVN